MDYYTAKDIVRITGVSKSSAYEIIKKLQTTFEKNFPDAIKLQGKIPIWYFEDIMMNKRKDGQNEKNENQE